jgi:dTDP-4-dehydrorhamnose reductase
LVEQAWERYGRTIAITEVHNGATREEQVRWFVEVWESAQELRGRGVDLCAVTAWSLLGAYDWNRMVTRFIGHYETGVFDVRTGTPRATLLAGVLKELAEGGKPSLPQIAGPGWWRRDTRLIHAAPKADSEYEVFAGMEAPGGARPLMIVADESELGRLAVRSCEARGLYYVRCSGSPERTLREANPWAVLDARDPDAVCGGSRRLRGADGSLEELAGRHDVPLALVTGAEEWHRSLEQPGVLEIRTGALFMPWDRSARAIAILDALDAGRPVEVDASAGWSRVYGPDVMDVLLDLLLDGVTGAVNVRPAERVSELEFARALAETAYRDPDLIRATGSPAPAPLFAWAGPASYLPPLETTLERLVREGRAARLAGDLAVERREDEVRLEAAE